MPASPTPLRIAAVGFSLLLLVAYVAYRSGVGPFGSSGPAPQSETDVPRMMPGSKSAATVEESDLVISGSKSGIVDVLETPPAESPDTQQQQRIVLPGSKFDLIEHEPPAEPAPTPEPTPDIPPKPQLLPGSKAFIISD